MSAVDRTRRFVYEFADFTIDPTERVARRAGAPIRLTPKAFDVLLALVEAPGRIVEKGALMGRVWGDAVVEEGNLKVTVSHLRKALGDARDRASIETVPRRGYRLMAEVRVVEPRPDARGRPVRLAVLPLANLSSGSRQDYFTDGLTDLLISDLARISGLHVISRTSVTRYKHTAKALPEIARELRVTHVLEGSVAAAGRRVRINVQLIEAATDTHVWARTYETSRGDVLRVQGEIAQAISHEVKAVFDDGEIVGVRSRGRATPEALDAYLRGRQHVVRLNAVDLQTAISLFQRAIERDPAYAPAYGELASAYVLASLQGEHPGQMLPKARDAAERGLDIDPDLPEALTALAEFEAHYRWNLARAEEHLHHAMRVSPSFADAHARHAGHLVAVGRFREAFDGYRRAQALDPMSPLYRSTLALGHYCARQPHAVMHHARKALALDPNLFLGFYWQGLAWEQLARFPEAVAALERAAAISPDNPLALAALGHAYAAIGDSRAHTMSKRLRERSRRRFVPSYQLAIVHAGLDERAEAIRCLEQAADERDPRLVWLNVEPRLEALRDASGFRAVVRRIGLSPPPTGP
jgi:TolB-like protein/Tfp pilus assembly protein PilF